MQFLIAVLAVMEIIEIWQHGSLFDRARARVELWEGRLGDLLRCPFCLAPYVSLFVALVLSLGEELTKHGFPTIGLMVQMPLYALAVARAANLGHDVTKTLL
jgi:hypothetical protein